MGRHHQHAHPDVVDLRHGDCLEQLRALPDSSVHAIITDPPYGLADHKPAVVAAAITAWATGDRERVPDGRGFMGRSWDAFVPPPAVWDECLRVLKPGGHLAVFAGSRTADLMGLSIRLAGFDMRDGISAWLYGSGFPKSHDIGKALDKAAGATREVVARRPGAQSISTGRYGAWGQDDGTGRSTIEDTAPATEAARAWSGWGTALKPAHEPILIARKPSAGTVAANVLAHGCGGLNVDACRVAAPDAPDVAAVSEGARARWQGGTFNGYRDRTPPENEPRSTSATSAGRWPTNVVLAHAPLLDPVTGEVIGDACADGCVPGCHVAALDEQSGTTTSIGGSRGASAQRSSMEGGVLGAQADVKPGFGDTGGASRFYPTFRYTAKAGKRERPQAWGAHPDCTCPDGRPFDLETGALPPWWRHGSVCSRCERPATFRGHPTVKPLGLVRWLLALLAAPGATVCDPFAGSGPLGQAVVERGDGTRAVLIERDPHHCELIRRRLAGAQPPAPPAPPVAPVLELALSYGADPVAA